MGSKMGMGSLFLIENDGDGEYDAYAALSEPVYGLLKQLKIFDNWAGQGLQCYGVVGDEDDV